MAMIEIGKRKGKGYGVSNAWGMMAQCAVTQQGCENQKGRRYDCVVEATNVAMRNLSTLLGKGTPLTAGVSFVATDRISLQEDYSGSRFN